VQEYDKKNQEYVVVDPGVSDKRLLVVDEEFAAALNSTLRSGNNLSSTIRGLFDDGDAAPLTKTNRISTTGAHVCILGHITFKELKMKLSETDMLNGFGNRFLWICARRQGIIAFPEPLPGPIKELLQGLIEERLKHAFRGGEYRFSQAARELWLAEYPRLSMEHQGLSGCMVNRAEANVVRISLIFAILSLHHQIELDDLEAALAFWQYCRDSAMLIFGGEQSDRRKIKLLNSLNSLNSPGLTKTEIIRDIFVNHISAETLNNLLDELEEDNLIKIEKVLTEGAPKTIISLLMPSEKSELSEISSEPDRNAA
jgi:hypothetical protein